MAKGPDSLGCLKLAKSLGADVTLGNHEHKMLSFEARVQTEDTASCEHEVLMRRLLGQPNLLDFVKKMPLFLPIAEHEACVVHAGCVPGLRPQENRKSALISMRNVVEDKSGSFVGSVSTQDGEPWASRSDARPGIPLSRQLHQSAWQAGWAAGSGSWAKHV